MSAALPSKMMVMAAFRGLDGARHRYRGVSGVAAKIVPLAEALYWIAILDEIFRSKEYEAERAHHQGGILIPGLRYARNFHTHELVATIAAGGGLTAPFTVPFTIQTHVIWRSVSELPRIQSSTKHSGMQRQGYADHLAGREPGRTLELTAQWLQSWHGASEAKRLG